MQPSHGIGDLNFAPDRLGPDRLGYAYPWQQLVDRGLMIIGGSDAPVEVGDPVSSSMPPSHANVWTAQTVPVGIQSWQCPARPR